MMVSVIIALTLTFLLPQISCAQIRSSKPAPPASSFNQVQQAANLAWEPFIREFRVAIKRRDREALKKMMSANFFSSGGNDAGPKAAFDYWDDPNVRGWEAFERVLAQGNVPNTAWRERGNRNPSRVAPPAANVQKNVEQANFEWYAVFEYRNARWYSIVFNQCCD